MKPLLAAAALLAAAGFAPGARAADVFATGHDWSGFYLGVNGGIGWNDSSVASDFDFQGQRVQSLMDQVDGDRSVRVRVEDDGPGVPPDNLETVFERFYTSRPKGAAFGSNSGLGLSIVRQIVEAHGGRVWAENRIEDGRVAGAVFEINLPAFDPVTPGRRP